MDKRLTTQIKEYARQLGADLVGFANIERFELAPIKMSPQGIMPTAKTVIVCAIHHPDATIELEGGEHGNSQIFDSYSVQYTMNSKLDHISFSIGHFLTKKGYNAVPIVSSNIWRYRSYKELNAVFSPDVSHIYASVAAGLSAMGWNGLALTPEYGPRNRFVTIITDAELEPTPLVSEKLCDMCGECIRCCPTDAYRKEVDGVKVLQIEDKVHKFANKNLWRCAWGEHFDINLDDEVPEVVDEAAILERIKTKGRRGGEMGVCLKVCVPPKIRFKDTSYSDYNRRIRLQADPSLSVSREVYDILSEIALKYHAGRITVVNKETAEAAGVQINGKMPDAKTIIYFSSKMSAEWSSSYPLQSAQGSGLRFAGYDAARELEKIGYSAMPNYGAYRSKAGLFINYELAEGESTVYEAVLTNAPIPEIDFFTDSEDAAPAIDLKKSLKNTALEYGADLFGVAPVSRIDDIKAQLDPIKGGERLLNARDKNPAFKPYDADIKETVRVLHSPKDYIKDAKSVIVLGMSFPAEVSKRAGQPPAEAVGPYIFAQSQVLNELGFAALEIARDLKRAGYKAFAITDLLGVGSVIGSPRGEYNAPFSGAFEAVAAGLGQLTYNGTVYTDEFGINQKFICIVTDAVLRSDSVIPNNIQASKCDECKLCFSECPMNAFKADKKATISIDGNEFGYIPLDTVYCQWASRYALTNRDGFTYLGSPDDFMPKGEITVDLLADTLKKRDPITKFRPGTSEQCITNCPLSIE